jgi:hypothetical protein
MMDENELQALYQWVDEIPLTRPKRNIARDFSDGVLMAEVTKYFFPKLVELHNYSGTQSAAQKVYNWSTLERKVFKKINFILTKEEIQDVANSVPGTVERVLFNFKTKVTQIHQKKLHGMNLQQQTTTVQYESIPSNSQHSSAAATTVAPAHASNTTNDETILSQYAARSCQQQGVLRHPQQPMDNNPQHLRQRDLANEIIAEKDATINEMRETIEILEVKIRKLEQLVKIKDQKIVALQSKLQQQSITQSCSKS